MAQRYDIVKIDFQANAGHANAAIESLRVKAEACNEKVKQLRKDLKDGIQMGKSSTEIENVRSEINAAVKETKVWSKAYNELIKGVRTFDEGVKAFNDGTLSQMSAAFQKTLYNATKLIQSKLDPALKEHKESWRQLQALMDASQQNYARLQGDASKMIQTLKEGGSVSRQALSGELQAQKELLQVLSATDKGYQQTVRNVAVLDNYLRAMGGDYEFIRTNMSDTKKVSDDMLRTMYSELEKVNQEGKVTKDILRDNARMMREIREEQAKRVQNVLGGDLGKQSENGIRQAIASAKELMGTYGSTSRKAQELAAQIVNAEEHLKTHGVEGVRAAKREAEAVQLLADKHKMMTERMSNLRNLSAGGLAETQKYWQAQMDGATRSSKAYKEAEANLKAINAEMERQRTTQLQTDAGKINRKNLSTLSEQEIQTSITAAKQLAASMKPTEDSYKRLVDNILRAEEHIKQFGLEGERSARQASQQMQTMVDRMGKLATLSDGALAETKKFWETQLVGAERGSTEAQKYETHIQAIVAEQERLAAEQAKTAAQGVYGDKMTMSEGAIRKAIESAKQYQQTLAATNPEYKRLTTAIVDAEDHIKKYGLEAERAARKEIEAAKKAAEEREKTNRAMEEQLRRGPGLTQSALKAQESYWQRMADDPKAANNEIARYFENLNRVHALQKEMEADTIKGKGIAALQFFRGDTSNASASQIQENAKALKTYRDSLPQKDNATIIAEIDGYIQKAGASAEKAAQQTMSLKDALRIGSQAGSGNFKGTVEQLNQAKKALEELSTKAMKGGYAWRRMQEGLQSIDLELKKVGYISKDVQAILDSPKGKSFNELKQAVEQGRKALADMRTDTKEGQRAFDELAKKVQAADFEMKQLGNSSKGTATAFDKAWSRLKTYITLYMGAAVAIQKLVGTLGDIMELSDKMGEVRKTTGFTADEVGRLSNNLAKLDTRTALTSLMELGSLAGSVGLKTREDVQGFVEAADQLIVALPEMGNESARTLIKIAAATGDLKKNNNDVRETLEKVGSTIIALRANSASAAGPITDFVSRVGAVGAQAGISIDQIAALGSTIDALGGRVEMSATALSRMIPAIRNNAFGVANAIGVTEKTLTDLFNQGKAMEAMVLIFEKMRESVQRFDTSTEEGQEAMAKNVEDLLGKNASMAEVMKELNQQGARAGIVFGLLSQNVDELKKQLGIASDAYEKNTALLNEYNNMNETTAAKLARLKNQLEEMFVSDSAQRFLGGVIDGLRQIADIISGNVTGALKALHVALISAAAGIVTFRIGLGEMLTGGLGLLTKGVIALKNAFVALFTVQGWKNMATAIHFLYLETVQYISLKWQLARAHDAEAAAAIRAKLANNTLMKTLSANAVLAVVAAVGMLIYKIVQWRKEAKQAGEEAARFNAELDKETKKVDKLFESVGKASVKVNDANKKVNEARIALEAAKKQMDGSKESADRLAEAESNLEKAENELRNTNDKHAKSINDINSQYGKYLGFMLSEVASANELAAARSLINEKLRETITLKRKEAALERIEKSEGEGRDKAYSGLYDKVYANSWTNVKGTKEKSAETAASLMRDITERAQGDFKSSEDFRSAVLQMVTGGKYKGKVGDVTAIADEAEAYYKKLHDIREKNRKVEDQFEAEEADNRKNTQKKLERQFRVAEERYKELYNDYANAQGDAKKTAAANLLKQMDSINEMMNAVDGYFEQDKDRQYKGEDSYYKALKTKVSAYTDLAKQRKELEKAAGDAYKANRQGGNGGGTTSDKPYGDYNRVTSPYEEWDANALVARRKEMLERVRALANGADVQRVLSEDAKFITEATRNNIKTTKQAIEWYNTERLKIQEALHDRYLTNTGDWQDPKKEGKKASKMVQDEMKYYLDELDAYYTERKTRIQAAATEEGVTEAEVRNRTLANEMEWRQRRAELQRLYAKKSEQVAQEEQDAIFDILSERTGETTGYIQKDIEQTVKFIEKVGKEKGKPAMDKILGDLDLAIERDFLKQQQAVTIQMRAIQDIIDKERPFNGITKNLRENLVTMGILTADMMEERNRLMKENADMSDFNSRQSAEEMKRTAFLLGEAESAYNTTIEEVMRRMADSGMQAWADELQKSPKMQQALMAQLRSTFDKVHEAVKKEASLLKKEAENMWNNILMPDGETTMKQFADRAVAALSMNENRVNRANQLVGAGQASERVADKLAIKQMQIQLTLQEHYYNLMKERGEAAVKNLQREANEAKALNNLHEYEQKMLDAKHAQMALNLATAKEETELAKQRESIMARTEDSQNRLYKELRSWVSLLGSSLTSVFEAMNSGGDLYNQIAILQAGGTYNSKTKETTTSSESSSSSTTTSHKRGGDTTTTDSNKSGTSSSHTVSTTTNVQNYYIIENAGTEDAKATEVEMTELEYYQKQLEIEQENATKDAIKKMLDDINMKFSEAITDQINAMLQDAAVHENMEATLRNTDAEKANTEALIGLTGKIDSLSGGKQGGASTDNGGAKQLTSVVSNDGTVKKTPKATIEIEPMTGGIIREGDMGVGEDGVPEALRRPEEGGDGGNVSQPSWVRTEEEAKQAVTNTQVVYDGIAEIEGEHAKTMAELQQEYGYRPPTVAESKADAEAMVENTGVVLEELINLEGEHAAEVGAIQQETGYNPVPIARNPTDAEAMVENTGVMLEGVAEQQITMQEAVNAAVTPNPGSVAATIPISAEDAQAKIDNINSVANAEIAADTKATNTIVANKEKEGKQETKINEKEKASANAKFAAMTMASQMYGIAYQTMSNDNLTATQKFASMALQMVGQMVINMMTTDMLKTEGQSKIELPGIFGKAVSSLGPIAGPIAFAGMTALLGGLMGMAASAVTKSKSEIAQVTGANSGGAVSTSAPKINVGRLKTGMLTYAEGNVNEFTDPSTLNSGRYYNVDGADGKTYRAKYMGKNAKTHITNGPEFHLVGEAGREAIIDAHTTRQIQMNEPEIWRSIQTLYNGGSLSHMPRRRRGMPAFADGNIDDFDSEMAGGVSSVSGIGMNAEQVMMLQASLDRNSEVLERALAEGIQGVFNVYGPDGLVDTYDTAKRTLSRHGERR